MSELHDERAELAEDEEKLQIALQEYGSEWLTEVEDDDEEDCLLIDLDRPLSSSDDSEGRSLSPSFTGSGSRIIALNENEEESQDVPTAPELPPEACKEAEVSESEKTLALNRALQGILEKHMEDIRVALEANKIKQQRLDDGREDQEALDDSKGRTFGPFRAPYFQHGISMPPPNEDVRLKKRTGELLYEEMHERLSLSVRNREILMEGVLDDLREQAMKPYMTKFDAEVKKVKELDLAIEETEIGLAQARTKMIAQQRKSHIKKKSGKAMCSLEKDVKKVGQEVKRLQQMLTEKKLEKEGQGEIMAALEYEMEKIKTQSKKTLMAGFDIDSVDWMKISKKYFEEKTSWVDCRKAWEHVMDPSLNHSQWTKKEENHLKELAEKYPEGSWDVIAKNLGTRRSAFMCFHHYQRCINPAFKTRPWTPEEDKHLLAVMKGMKDGASFFNWRKVSALIESRSATECMYRHTKLDEELNHGRWEKEEDARLLAAVEIMGTSWAKVSRYIRHRTATQCRDRYTQSLDPELNFNFFTYDEDMKILRLRREGMSWSKLVPHFQGRTDNMLTCRHNTLQKWKKEEAWWQTQSSETQELLKGKYLSMSERQSQEGETSKFYNLRLGVGNADYERQQRDRDKGVPEDLIPPRPPFHLKYARFSRLQRSLSARKWTDRIIFHSRLKENLSNLMAKESGQVAKQMPKEEEETEEEKQTIMKLIDTSATQTMKGCKSTKKGHQEMLNTLNRHFLGNADVSVRELLETTKKKESPRPKKISITGWRVNSELNKILRNNNRAYHKRGRVPKALPRDGRIKEKIESETQEVKRSIPILMLELLCPGFSNIHNLVKHRSLDLEAERSKVESFKNDADYKSRVEMLESRIEEFRHQVFLMPSQRDKEIAKVQKKLTKLRRIFKSHYHERKKKFDCFLELLNHDVEYVNSLKNIETELPNEYLSKASRVEPSPVAATQLMSSPQTSAALMPLSSENKTPEAAGSNGVEEKRKPRLCRNEAMISSLRKRKEPESEQLSTAVKRPRYKTLEQLENDRKKIPTWVKRSVTDLPYLPPTCSTMKALRALLLNRQELVKAAGELYDVENYRKRTQPPFEVVVRGCTEMKEEVNTHSGDSSMDNASAERGSDQVYPRCFPELDNSRKELDNYLKELGLERTPRKGSSVNYGLSQNSVIPSSNPSMPAIGGNQITSVSQNLQYLGSTHLSDLKLKQKVQQLIPTPKDSKYEVSYGITTHSRCYGHMEKEAKKLSADVNNSAKTALPSSSTSASKVLTIPKVSNQNCPILVCPSSRGRFYRVQEKPSSSSPGPPPNPSGPPPKLQHGTYDSKKSSNSGTGESAATVHLMPVNKGKLETGVVTGPTFSKLLKKALPNSPHLGKVVVVGLDPKTKKVVHFTPSPGTDVFKPVQGKNGQDRETSKETVSAKETESATVIVKRELLTVDRNGGDKKPEPKIIAKAKVDPNIIQTIRQTDEYKNFFTRLRSLFMWPVLMSTIAPPEMPVRIPEQQPAKRRGRRFLTKAFRQQWKRHAAERREARLQAERKKAAEKEKAAENPALENIKDETKVPQKKRGRKRKGLSSNRPRPVKPRVQRPVRMVRRKQEAMKAILQPQPPGNRSLPSWWKEAIVEVMVTQKAIEDGKMLPDVKSLSEDEDFQDKGNYSDDDGWLASLLEEERKEKERMRLLKRALGEETGEEEEEEEEERMGRVRNAQGGRMEQDTEEEEEDRKGRMKEVLNGRMGEKAEEEEDIKGRMKEVLNGRMGEKAEEEEVEERIERVKEALGERMEEEGEEERLTQAREVVEERMEEEEEGEEERLRQVREVVEERMEEEERLRQAREAVGEKMEEETEEDEDKTEKVLEGIEEETV